MRRVILPRCLLAVLALGGAAGVAGAQQVTIYRCTDARGALTLRDSPCQPGEREEIRTLQRPQDPPRATAILPTPATTSPAPAAPPPPRVVYATPPRPMYECVTPDGERYSSDTDEGNPRWVPYWTLGYAYFPPSRPGRPGPPAHPHPPGPGPRPPAGVVVPAGGTWVRDECHALPQAEVCARLSERRYEILRRYNSAMPSERRELDREQRGIDARMNNDCGGT